MVIQISRNRQGHFLHTRSESFFRRRTRIIRVARATPVRAKTWLARVAPVSPDVPRGTRPVVTIPRKNRLHLTSGSVPRGTVLTPRPIPLLNAAEVAMNVIDRLALGDTRMEATLKTPRLGRGLNALLGDLSVPHASDATVCRLAVDEIAYNPVPAAQAVRRRGTRLADREREDPRHPATARGARRSATASSSSPASAGSAPRRPPASPRCRSTSSTFDDQQVFEAALVENIQRSDLNPIEKAQGFKEYMDRFGMTQDQLGGAPRPRPLDREQPARPAEPPRRRAGRGAERPDSRWGTRRCSRA